MVLVDTSIWVSHLRMGDARLKDLLQALPMARMAKNDEVLRFIEAHGLMGVVLGLIDVHLLASALLSKALLWTTDKPLGEASAKLNVAYQ